MGPSVMSRVCRMLGLGDKKIIDAQKMKPLYGKTGTWPRLILMQRVCSDGVGSDVAWTKMGGEVNQISQIRSNFACFSSVKIRTLVLCPI